MPLLAELATSYITVAIKISLLRSWKSRQPNHGRSIWFFYPAAAAAGLEAKGFRPDDCESS